MLGALGQFALGQFPFIAGQIVVRPDIGGYVKKRKRHDLVAEDLRREAQLRHDLELAVYGPPIEDLPKPLSKPILVKPQSDVTELARMVVFAERMRALNATQKAAQDDEDDLEMIMRDLG